MKKIYSLLLFATIILGSLNAIGQSQRMVLIEEGTNASCVPCANQNPGFHAMLSTVADKHIGLTYQWHFPGYDPMHDHNPSEANQRFETYYGQNGVPTAMIDGDVPDGSTPGFNGSAYDGAPAGYSAQMIENRYEVSSPFDISIEYNLTPSDITATITVTCTEAINAANLKLRIAVIEKLISFDTPPGSTNQDEFHNVMKKFLPNATGLSLQNSWMPGDNQTFTESWAHQNVYDYSEIAIVAFVQNDSGKEVLQAAFSDEGALESNSSNAAGVFNLEAPADICSGINTIAPTVSLRNTGNETLTSCNIVASINGTEEIFEWTGSLDLMQDEIVTLDPFSFEADDNSELIISVVNTNGSANEEAMINMVSTTIDNAPNIGNGVLVEISTDNYADETYWRIVNSDGVKVAEGGNDIVEDNYNTGNVPPTSGPDTYDSNSDYDIEVLLDGSDCYTFEIFDYYGDGMCCQYGNGFFRVRNLATNEPIITGGSFTGTDNGKFEATVTSISENNLSSNLKVFPNPVINTATIETVLSERAEVLIEVFDLTGKIVFSENFGTQPAGAFNRQIDFDGINTGMYLLNLRVGESTVVRKMTVNK